MPGLLWEKREIKTLFNSVKEGGISFAARKLARTETACTQKYYSELKKQNSSKQELINLIEKTGDRVVKHGSLFKVITN
jgi:hypothetical protein